MFHRVGLFTVGRGAGVGVAAALLLAGCGGGSGGVGGGAASADDPAITEAVAAAPRPRVNQPPVASIASPSAALTFKAGDTLAFSGGATDREDGAVPEARLTWWAELHHDTHSHPLQPPTAGSSGNVTLPTRGETSHNIWYRFHLRATDAAGAMHQVTRDVLPRKVQVTLATVPAGLGLTLDGQPVLAPHAFTGVVGIERDLAAAEQSVNGRRYTFSRWSDGGSAAHTVFTPAADTTYTATFVDAGPVANQQPAIAITAPAPGAAANVGVPLTLAAAAADSDDRVASVEFFENGVQIGAPLTAAPWSVVWTPRTAGARSLTARAIDNYGLGATSAAVAVTVALPGNADVQPPVATLIAPLNLAAGLAGTLTVSAAATDNVGVSTLEIQLDGATVGSVGTGSPHSVSVDTTAHAPGQHVLRARATDAAGNPSPWASATVSFAGSRTQPAGFVRNESFVTGISSATALAQARDGRFFVAQQQGLLRVVKNGALLATPFLTLAVDDSGERGLLGVALHPAFADNGHVYVHYTTTQNGAHNRISRFTADPGSPDAAAAGSEVVIADLPALSSATVHNGGAMHFGADGTLYVAVGDNATGTNAQNPALPLGKMLRFNADGSIPADNPYAATRTGLARAIWASGLRNPFSFAVQPGTGRIHINDVGADTWEEINLGAPGANYGWPASEGPANVGAGVTAPVFAYGRNAATPAGSGPGGFFNGVAVTGGAFYPALGAFPPAYRNSYYFTDFGTRFIGRLDLANNNAAYAFGSVTGSPVGLLVGLDGALYVLTRDSVVRFAPP